MCAKASVLTKIVNFGDIPYMSDVELTAQEHQTDETYRRVTIDDQEYEIRLLNTNELPLTLPDLEDFAPNVDGQSPLAKSSWSVIRDEEGNEIGRRETDTMPNWAGSSWYYLRFTDPKNSDEFASQQNLKYWLPVDHYFGGNEHTTLHLLYSRFWHRFLYDRGHVPTIEPYINRTNGGLLLGPDGTKMSKSKGNVIQPEEKIDEVGADALRLYVAFIGPYDGTVVWQDGGLKACKRVIDTVWDLQYKVKTEYVDSKSVLVAYNKLIKTISGYIESLKLNVAVAEIMTFVNIIKGEESISLDTWKGFLKVLSPFCPHITEELWYIANGFTMPQILNNNDSPTLTYQMDYTKSIHLQSWPQYDEKLIIDETIVYAVQVNGKVRGEFSIPINASDDQILEFAQQTASKYIEGKSIKFSKIIQNKLVTLVVEQ